MTTEHRFTITVSSANPSIENLTERLARELRQVLGDDITVSYGGETDPDDEAALDDLQALLQALVDMPVSMRRAHPAGMPSGVRP